MIVYVVLTTSRVAGTSAAVFTAVASALKCATETAQTLNRFGDATFQGTEDLTPDQRRDGTIWHAYAEDGFSVYVIKQTTDPETV